MQPSGQQAGNSTPASWLQAGPGTRPGVGRVGREREAEGWQRVRGERLPSVKGGAKRGWEVGQGRAWRRAFRTFSPRGTPPGLPGSCETSRGAHTAASRCGRWKWSRDAHTEHRGSPRHRWFLTWGSQRRVRFGYR